MAHVTYRICYRGMAHVTYSICYRGMAHVTYQNNTSKIFVLRKEAKRAINNLSYNEHTNEYFKCNKIPKLSDK